MIGRNSFFLMLLQSAKTHWWKKIYLKPINHTFLKNLHSSLSLTFINFFTTLSRLIHLSFHPSRCDLILSLAQLLAAFLHCFLWTIIPSLFFFSSINSDLSQLDLFAFLIHQFPTSFNIASTLLRFLSHLQNIYCIHFFVFLFFLFMFSQLTHLSFLSYASSFDHFFFFVTNRQNLHSFLHPFTDSSPFIRLPHSSITARPRPIIPSLFFFHVTFNFVLPGTLWRDRYVFSHLRATGRTEWRLAWVTCCFSSRVIQSFVECVLK